MLKSADKKEQGQEMLVLAEKILGSSLKSASGVTVGDVYAMLDAWAPFASQCGWDHSGLQTGSMEKEITGVVVALDCTDEVIDYAVASGANLILTHHPLIFDPLFAVTDDMPAAKLVKNGIALICAHTNLDLADGGVTDCLAQELELSDCVPFGEDHAGRIGMPEHSMTAEELVGYVKRRLKCNLLYWEGDRPVRRIAVVGGAGSEFAWDAAAAGADAYITGELKHNYFMDLSGTGMTLIAAGHYATERVVLPAVKARLQKKFPGIPVQIFELTRMKSC